MTSTAILIGALLFLLAFGVEHLAKVTGIPSVVALIAMGGVGKPLLERAGIHLGDLSGVVPLLGTVGLVLIVLEGAFDLELRKERLRSVMQSMWAAVGGLLVTCAVLALMTWLWGAFSVFDALLLTLPFAVISSAVAIPSSEFLPTAQREFVVYESTLSDILGILLFFAMLDSDRSVFGVLTSLTGNGLLSLLLGAVSAVGLLFLMLKLQGHIRFIPLLAGLFLLYAVGKLMHLSPLILVLVFGLVLNNPALLGRVGLLQKVYADTEFDSTVKEFKALTCELTFAVRGIFFILLGYWTDLTHFADWRAWVMAAVVLVALYALRRGLMSRLRIQHAEVLTWMAPRGLITVLLYWSAKEVISVPAYLDGAVMLIVIGSALGTGLARWYWQKDQAAAAGMP